MSDLDRKLQLRGSPLRVLDVPDGLDLGVARAPDADGVLLFVRDRAALEARAMPVLEAARRDAAAWIAYPKAGQLGTDLNRDLLVRALSGRGVRPVRQISIDDVWSALRFRPAADAG